MIICIDQKICILCIPCQSNKTHMGREQGWHRARVLPSPVGNTRKTKVLIGTMNFLFEYLIHPGWFSRDLKTFFVPNSSFIVEGHVVDANSYAFGLW